MPFSYSVLQEVVGSLCLRVKFKWGISQKKCALSGTGLTDLTLQQGDQNLPMGHIVSGVFSAENISPCILGRGHIAGITSAVALLQFFPPKRISAEWKKALCGCRLLMGPTFFRSTWTRVLVKVFVQLFFPGPKVVSGKVILSVSKY